MRDQDLHPYDGRERRFRDSDADQRHGRAIVGRVLGLATLPSVVLYDLSFYSGGSGVFDRVAITMPSDAEQWPQVVESVHAYPLTETLWNREALEDVAWLFDAENEPVSAAALRFINFHRQPFQDECTPTSRLFVDIQSDVNAYRLLWGDEHRLNYLGHSEG